MLGLVEADDYRLGAVLDLVRDPHHLWSSHGVRSLSKQDRYYGTSESYWQSPIWININYLILKELLVSYHPSANESFMVSRAAPIP